MAKMFAPDPGVLQVDGVSGRRYEVDGLRHRRYHVTDPADARAMKDAGFIEAGAASLATAQARGFVCTSCGRATLIRTCGRCGDAPCVRPESYQEA